MLEKLLDIVFPENIYCISCGKAIDKTRNYSLCNECMEMLPWITERACKKCGRKLSNSYPNDTCYDCRTSNYAFDRGISSMEQGKGASKILSRYKRETYLAKHMGEIMYDRLEIEGLEYEYITGDPLLGKDIARRTRKPFIELGDFCEGKGEGDNILIAVGLYEYGDDADKIARNLKEMGAGDVYVISFASTANMLKVILSI